MSISEQAPDTDPGMSRSDDDLRMDVPALFGALVRKWKRVVLVTLALLVATGVLLMFVPKVYESSAGLLVEQRDNGLTGITQPANSSSAISVDALMSSQIELIKSRDLLLDVINSQDLRSVPEFTNSGFSPAGLLLGMIGRKPAPSSLDETVLSNLQDRLSVIRERDSAVITVSVRSTDAKLAARVANAIAAAHVKRRAQQTASDAAEATVWLQGEIDRLRTKVEAAETAVANYKIANNLFSGPNDTPVADQALSSVSQQIVEAQQRKNAAEARAAMLRRLVRSGDSIESATDVRDSVTIQRLLDTRASLKSDLALKSTTLLANHPTIKALKSQIRDVDAQIVSEGNKIAASLDAEAKVEADLIDRLTADLQKARSDVSDATKGGVTLDSLQREAKAQRDLLESYLAKYSDALSRSADNAVLPDVRVVSEAAPAAEPASPKTPLILGAVGFVALALQVGALLFGELMSGRALVPVGGPGAPSREPQEEEAAVEEKPVRARKAETIRSSGPTALEQICEEIADGKFSTVMVAGLGNTDARAAVLTRLIGAAIAAGRSAVTVEAAGSEVTAEPGLTDLSLERADYGDVVVQLEKDLALVPWGRSGKLDRRSSRPMTLVEALADIYHVVVVDTGAIGLPSSLPLFSGLSAPVVLVGEASTTPVALAAARRDVVALGFDVIPVVDGARQDIAVA